VGRDDTLTWVKLDQNTFLKGLRNGVLLSVAVRLAEQGIAVLDAPPAMGCADCPDCIHA
jgi:hypothetical protein